MWDVETQQAVPGPFRTLWRRWWGWEDGGMPDAVPPVDLARLAAGGGHPGALWRLDGEDLQANLVRLGQGDRIERHRNDEVDVLMVVISGRGELTLDGQIHQLARWSSPTCPRGRSER
jgi:quercetin dioxygenase-like cupin family protein